MGSDLGYPSTVELPDGEFVTVWYEGRRIRRAQCRASDAWSLEFGAGAILPMLLFIGEEFGYDPARPGSCGSKRANLQGPPLIRLTIRLLRIHVPVALPGIDRCPQFQIQTPVLN